MIAPTLARLLDPKPLKPAEARAVFEALLAPSTRDAERTAVLMALAARKVTASELATDPSTSAARVGRRAPPSTSRP
jgi:anthranilate phosphoribosyltransferase